MVVWSAHGLSRLQTILKLRYGFLAKSKFSHHQRKKKSYDRVDNIPVKPMVKSLEKPEVEISEHY